MVNSNTSKLTKNADIFRDIIKEMLRIKKFVLTFLFSSHEIIILIPNKINCYVISFQQFSHIKQHPVVILSESASSPHVLIRLRFWNKVFYQISNVSTNIK